MAGLDHALARQSHLARAPYRFATVQPANVGFFYSSSDIDSAERMKAIDFKCFL
jgi:hypothetical protein